MNISSSFSCKGPPISEQQLTLVSSSHNNCTSCSPVVVTEGLFFCELQKGYFSFTHTDRNFTQLFAQPFTFRFFRDGKTPSYNEVSSGCSHNCSNCNLQPWKSFKTELSNTLYKVSQNLICNVSRFGRRGTEGKMYVRFGQLRGASASDTELVISCTMLDGLRWRFIACASCPLQIMSGLIPLIEDSPGAQNSLAGALLLIPYL